MDSSSYRHLIAKTEQRLVLDFCGLRVEHRPRKDLSDAYILPYRVARAASSSTMACQSPPPGPDHVHATNCRTIVADLFLERYRCRFWTTVSTTTPIPVKTTIATKYSSPTVTTHSMSWGHGLAPAAAATPIAAAAVLEYETRGRGRRRCRWRTQRCYCHIGLLFSFQGLQATYDALFDAEARLDAGQSRPCSLCFIVHVLRRRLTCLRVVWIGEGGAMGREVEEQ